MKKGVVVFISGVILCTLLVSSFASAFSFKDLFSGKVTGMAVEGEKFNSSRYCEDSDSGIFTYTAGYVNDKRGYFRFSGKRILPDKCTGAIKQYEDGKRKSAVKEYYCEPKRGRIAFENIACEEGCIDKKIKVNGRDYVSAACYSAEIANSGKLAGVSEINAYGFGNYIDALAGFFYISRPIHENSPNHRTVEKYNIETGELVWSYTLDPSIKFVGIINVGFVDEAGNVYIIAAKEVGDITPAYGIAKLDSNGNLLWSHFEKAGDVFPHGIGQVVVDSKSDVYYVGLSKFSRGKVPVVSGVVKKLNGADGKTIWSYFPKGATREETTLQFAGGLTLDSSGEYVYASGTQTSMTSVPNLNAFEYSYWIVHKLNTTNGSKVWQYQDSFDGVGHYKFPAGGPFIKFNEGSLYLGGLIRWSTTGKKVLDPTKGDNPRGGYTRTGWGAEKIDIATGKRVWKYQVKSIDNNDKYDDVAGLAGVVFENKAFYLIGRGAHASGKIGNPVWRAEKINAQTGEFVWTYLSIPRSPSATEPRLSVGQDDKGFIYLSGTANAKSGTDRVIRIEKITA